MYRDLTVAQPTTLGHARRWRLNCTCSRGLIDDYDVPVQQADGDALRKQTGTKTRACAQAGHSTRRRPGPARVQILDRSPIEASHDGAWRQAAVLTVYDDPLVIHL